MLQIFQFFGILPSTPQGGVGSTPDTRSINIPVQESRLVTIVNDSTKAARLITMSGDSGRVLTIGAT